MKTTLTTLALLAALTAAPAHAACVAEYKAKKDNPLRLDHGTITVPGDDCSPDAVRAAVAAQLAAEGWTLLNILSVQKSG